MLGHAQPSLVTPPPPSAWPLEGHIGLGPTRAGWTHRPSVDPLEPTREALIESFNRRASVAPTGLGQGGVYVLRSRLPAEDRQRHHPRDREMAWRQAHQRELREFVGQWVIVEGDELIGNGCDARALVAAARDRGIRVPYIFFVEPYGERTVKFGL